MRWHSIDTEQHFHQPQLLQRSLCQYWTRRIAEAEMASTDGDNAAVSLKPNWKTVRVVLYTAAAGFTLTTLLSISGNGATSQNVTWNNFQGAVGAACIITIGPKIAWVKLSLAAHHD